MPFHLKSKAKDQCKRGHDLTVRENRTPDGRQCRLCAEINNERKRQRRAEARRLREETR